MTSEQILLALGNIDEKLLDVCLKPVEKKTFPMRSVGAFAACVAAVVLSTVAITHHYSRPPVAENTAVQNAAVTEEESNTFVFYAEKEETGTEILPAQESATEELPQIHLPDRSVTAAASTYAVPKTQAPAATKRTETAESTSAAGQRGGAGVKSAATAPAAATAKASTTAASYPWDNAPITSRFPNLTYNGRTYTSRGNSDLRGKVQQSLGTVTLQGYDGSADHQTTAELFVIPGISTDAAVAVQFPDGGVCCAYVSPQYRPATLGQLMDDLSLQSNMTFGKVYGTVVGCEATIYPAVPDSEVWRMLFDRSARLDERDVYREETVLIDIRLPLLGYPAGHIRLTADGYLIVPLLESEKVYFIGKERAQSFLTYLDTMEGGTKPAYTTATSAPAVSKGGIETTVQTTK